MPASHPDPDARAWDGLSAQCVWAMAGRTWRPHGTDGWRLVPYLVALHGRTTVYRCLLPGRAPRLTAPREVVLVPGGVRHDISCADSGILDAAHVLYRMPGGIDPLSLFRVPLIVAGPPAERLAEAIIAIGEADPASLRGAATRQAAAFDLLALAIAASEPDALGFERFRRHHAVLPALRAVDERPGAAWTPASLAATCGLSRAHFCRVFRAATAASPMAWVLARRLERARLLLADPAVSVGEVAADTGFCDQFHFSRCFARAFGSPPNAWRRSVGEFIAGAG